MTTTGLPDLIKEGVAEAKAGNTLMGLMHLEKAVVRSRTPEVCAWLGYCLAQERRDFPKALELCKEAIAADSKDPDLYLAMARIYLSAGRRRSAIGILRRGLKVGRSEEIIEALQRLGIRKEPVFGFLPRESAINVYAGLMLGKLKMR